MKADCWSPKKRDSHKKKRTKQLYRLQQKVNNWKELLPGKRSRARKRNVALKSVKLKGSKQFASKRSPREEGQRYVWNQKKRKITHWSGVGMEISVKKRD